MTTGSKFYMVPDRAHWWTDDQGVRRAGWRTGYGPGDSVYEYVEVPRGPAQDAVKRSWREGYGGPGNPYDGRIVSEGADYVVFERAASCD